jgi:hydrogenase maturation protein HypF
MKLKRTFRTFKQENLLRINEPSHRTQRLLVILHGAVQGVGFRPFVYRLAAELNLLGWVSNSPQGVHLEVEGTKDVLDCFLLRVQKEIPPRAFIQSLEASFLDPAGYTSFEIRESESTGEIITLILPDSAVCPDCLKEIFDPSDRRFLYPFTNCTNCGPRFSIIEALPYDRPNTSMKIFTMCPECKAEYENPTNRRFHAQPNACPVCGPQIQLWDENGNTVADQQRALLQSAEAIRAGKIVAVKGLGGFHLIVDARNEEAVQRLRTRKHREEKPFALMFPSIEEIKKVCETNELEERLLLSPESPIVLLRRIRKSGDRNQNELHETSGGYSHSSSCLSTSVAPNNPYLGCMLPYTPLHHMLMRELGFPVIATSGNLSDEPICTEEHEALQQLHGIADVFLVHNRPIVRHVDDSIVRLVMGRESVIRRARGYAPLPITVETQHVMSLLAVGAHLKNTLALASGSSVFVSQHIGDLETQQSLDAFHRVGTDFQTMYQSTPSHVICDLHPDYLSTKFARSLSIKKIEIQHHYAHIASCMAENHLSGEVLGVSWDGTGYGTDGTIWGGEFLLTTETSFQRVAAFRSFRLPGGEKAVQEPRRTALGMLFELFGVEVFRRQDLPLLQTFTTAELELVQQMLLKHINSPVTTSVGRLFDAVASLIDAHHLVHYEGQAAMELEFLTNGITSEEQYHFTVKEGLNRLSVDWQSMIEEILKDIHTHVASANVSVKFHNTLVESIIAIAKHTGQPRVVLSGGCFQNLYLTERTIRRLREEGFHPYWHQRVPPNDGGISLGQVYAALRSLKVNIT